MKKILIATISILMLSIACSDNNEGSSESENNFERSEILVSWADNFIIPQYESFLEDTETLVVAKDAFINEPNTSNLVELRESLTEAYTSFQPAATYSFLGKAEELNYYLNLNAYALDVVETLENIAIYDTVDLSSTLHQDTQGLPAVDYLVNGLADTDDEIVAFYTGDEAENYKGYLSNVIDRIESLTQQVTDDWKNGYRDTFVNNTSSSSSGSFDLFMNAYIEYFESRLRRSKIDVPSGILTSTTNPDEIESLYNPILSKSLLVVALDNAESIYLGEEGENMSLSYILTDLGFSELDTTLKDAYNEAQSVIETDLNDDLRSQVINDNSKMLAVRDDLQAIVSFLKTDAASVLGVDITFVDNDND